MKMQKTFIGIVAGAILITGTAATAQDRSVDPRAFQERLITWAKASERAIGPGGDLARKISALSDEQIQIWLSMIDDPDAFLRSIEQTTTRLQNPALLWTQAVKAPTNLVTSSSPTTSATSFPPDYPPGSGPYKDTIIDELEVFGIGVSPTNRCDASDWGAFVGVWWPLNKAIDTLEGACAVATCDPIGLICSGVCGIFEISKISLKVAAVPLEACAVHQGAIDKAEIEATYENTLGLAADLSHVHDDLATHDAEIKALLTALQNGIDENQQKLDQIIIQTAPKSKKPKK